MNDWQLPPSSNSVPLFCPNCFSDEMMGVAVPASMAPKEHLESERVENEGMAFDMVRGSLCFDCKHLTFYEGTSIEAPNELLAAAEQEKERLEQQRESSNQWSRPSGEDNQFPLIPFPNATCPECNRQAYRWREPRLRQVDKGWISLVNPELDGDFCNWCQSGYGWAFQPPETFRSPEERDQKIKSNKNAAQKEMFWKIRTAFDNGWFDASEEDPFKSASTKWKRLDKNQPELFTLCNECGNPNAVGGTDTYSHIGCLNCLTESNPTGQTWNLADPKHFVDLEFWVEKYNDANIPIPDHVNYYLNRDSETGWERDSKTANEWTTKPDPFSPALFQSCPNCGSINIEDYPESTVRYGSVLCFDCRTWTINNPEGLIFDNLAAGLRRWFQDFGHDKQKREKVIDRIPEDLTRRLRQYTSASYDDDWDEYNDWLNERETEHEYDPSWDYEIRFDQRDSDMLVEAQTALNALVETYGAEYGIGYGWVYPVNLEGKGAVAYYINGTYKSPIIVIDLDAHIGYEDQISITIAHEFQHAIQEAKGEDFNEDDAEDWGRNAKTANDWIAPSSDQIPLPNTTCLECGASAYLFSVSGAVLHRTDVRSICENDHQVTYSTEGGSISVEAIREAVYPADRYLGVGWRLAPIKTASLVNEFIANQKTANDWTKYPGQGQLYLRQCPNCGGEDFSEISATQKHCKDCGWGAHKEWDYNETPDPFKVGEKPTPRKPRFSAETRSQALQRAQSVEDEVTGPDQSIIAYTFDDGWTIRQLTTYGDAHREGVMMSNCLQYGGAGWFPDNTEWERDAVAQIWPEFLYSTGDWQSNNEIQNAQFNPDKEIFDSPLISLDPIYSLRDPDNLPHVSIYDDGHSDFMMLGKHNGGPKPEYIDKLEEWIQNGNPSINTNKALVELDDHRISNERTQNRTAGNEWRSPSDQPQLIPNSVCPQCGAGAHIFQEEDLYLTICPEGHESLIELLYDGNENEVYEDYIADVAVSPMTQDLVVKIPKLPIAPESNPEIFPTLLNGYWEDSESHFVQDQEMLDTINALIEKRLAKPVRTRPIRRTADAEPNWGNVYDGGDGWSWWDQKQANEWGSPSVNQQTLFPACPVCSQAVELYKGPNLPGRPFNRVY
jgi:hypothetical protein